jgi:tRNA dimethylallyltransferase
MNKPLIVIVGPTAVGKSGAALLVARELNGEIISADSMQVYKHMDLGTAKPTQEEMRMVKHHLVDIVHPWQEFSVADFQRLAKSCITEIQGRGRLPIVVGGTGLYINSLVYNLNFADTVSDPELRTYLGSLARERGNQYLYEMLKRIDPDSALKLHANDIRRIIRAIEVYHCTGKPMSVQRDDAKERKLPYQPVIFGLKMERDRLYKKIEQRVDKMIAGGLVDEVKDLLERGCKREMVSMQGLGYKEIIGCLEGDYSLDDAIELLKRNTRRFAKRQFTWFKRDDRIIWVDVDRIGNSDDIANTIIEHIRFKLSI